MNKTILITGAAKRIGKEIALTYCEMGWNIIIHYNSSKDDAQKLAETTRLDAEIKQHKDMMQKEGLDAIFARHARHRSLRSRERPAAD